MSIQAVSPELISEANIAGDDTVASKIKHKFNQDQFSKNISKKSKVQVINIKDKEELKKYIKKNLINDEMIICMGAGSISNWIREIGDELK